MYPDIHPEQVVDVAKRYVRITGTHQGFVEFDFAIGDPEITVELILPTAAFDEFCRMNNVVQLDTGETT
jgi:phenol hydroxylase P0 protein